MTVLCDIANKYGSDKCPSLGHGYTPVYWELFKGCRNKFRKIVEIGIGGGASLRMWEEFFPNALIFGADNNKEFLFSEGRIRSVFCDQKNPQDLLNLFDIVGPDVDLFVDDASHARKDMLFTAKFLLPLFNNDITYVIEDSKDTVYLARNLVGYKCDVYKFSPKHKQDTLVVIRKR